MAKAFNNPFEQKENNHMSKEQLASRQLAVTELLEIPTDVLIKTPKDLKGDKVATKTFKQIVKNYKTQSILNDLDVEALIVYSKAYSRWIKYNSMLDNILNDQEVDLLNEDTTKSIDKIEKWIKTQVSIMTDKGKELKLTARDRIGVACKKADNNQTNLQVNLFGGGGSSGERRTFEPSN